MRSLAFHRPAIALAVSLACSMAASGPARAQLDQDPFAELQRLVGPLPKTPAAPAPRPRPAPQAARPAVPQGAQPAIDTSYVPDPGIRQQVYAAFVREMAQTNPARAQALAQRFAARDVIKEFDQIVAHYGLRSNHVADAMAAYWLSYWATATNYGPQIQPSQAVGVRVQVERSLAAIFARLDTGAKRQFMAETLILRTLNVAGLQSDARRTGSIPAQQYVANAAAAEFMNAGIDLRGLDLMSQGFQKRR